MATEVIEMGDRTQMKEGYQPMKIKKDTAIQMAVGCYAIDFANEKNDWYKKLKSKGEDAEYDAEPFKKTLRENIDSNMWDYMEKEYGFTREQILNVFGSVDKIMSYGLGEDRGNFFKAYHKIEDEVEEEVYDVCDSVAEKIKDSYYDMDKEGSDIYVCNDDVDYNITELFQNDENIRYVEDKSGVEIEDVEIDEEEGSVCFTVKEDEEVYGMDSVESLVELGYVQEVKIWSPSGEYDFAFYNGEAFLIKDEGKEEILEEYDGDKGDVEAIYNWINRLGRVYKLINK